MRITIAHRFAPFSHRPGVCLWLPGTTTVVQAFPTRLRFKNMVTGQISEQLLDVQGPVRPFTVQQDLEKGHLSIFGNSANGFVRSTFEAGTKPSLERLSLGSHKSQDWDQMARRADLKEILPLWFYLDQWLPEAQSGGEGGNLLLLETLKSTIAEKKKEAIAADFLNFFESSFSEMLIPTLNDERFLGIAPYKEAEGSPYFLLKEGAKLIRSLFISHEEDVVSLLPALPPEFHSGRMTSIKIGEDRIDLEWSKKLLQRVIWRVGSTRTLHLNLQKSIKTFRVRKSLREKGIKKNRSDPLDLKVADVVYLDRFES